MEKEALVRIRASYPTWWRFVWRPHLVFTSIDVDANAIHPTGSTCSPIIPSITTSWQQRPQRLNRNSRLDHHPSRPIRWRKKNMSNNRLGLPILVKDRRKINRRHIANNNNNNRPTIARITTVISGTCNVIWPSSIPCKSIRINEEMMTFSELWLYSISSEFEDWRPGLAQLLQPVPFPDEALVDDDFIKYFIFDWLVKIV